MSGVGEASLVLGIISSIIAIVTAAKNVYDAANDASGLPKAFHNVAAKLPIVVVILKQASDYAERPEVEEGTRNAFQRILYRCETSAKELREIFERAIPKDGASRFDRGVSAAKSLRKGGRVEELLAEILKEIGLLLASSSFATQKTLQRFDKAMEEVSMTDPSLPDNLVASLPFQVNSNGEGQVTRLKEIRYAKDQIRRKSDDPKAYLAEWLLSQSMPLSAIISEHDTHLEKRFSNPHSSYTTCSWFFESAEYRKFVEVGTSTILRIQGSPGCGKSVLSSAIIHELESLGGGTTPPRVLFCYGCRDPEQTSSMTLARILLAQTLQWSSPEMISKVEIFQQKHPILKNNDGKSEEELWRLLYSVLALQIQKVYIIIDGLDECAQPLICVRSLIKVMTKLAASCHCGLLLSSRLQRRDLFENRNVMTALQKADVKSLKLDMTQEFTRQDLKEFVAFQVATRSSFLSSTQLVREKIITSVCEKAKGMFLYANLVLEDLKGETISSIADIDLTLANLPEDLFNTYRQNLEVPKRARRGRETFRWILCSNPALTWHELKSALAIGTSGYVESEIILDGCDTFIEHTCGQLVESYGESECLRFIHPTVKDFLLESEELGDGLDISESNAMISSKLLTFLDYPDLPYFSSTAIESPEQVIKAYSVRTGRGLYPFATFNWYKHLKKCDKRENPQLEIQVLTFLGSISFIRWLKSAIIMSRASGDGRDSASLTTDVIDSLQSWAMGKVWCSDDAESKLQAWIQDFLNIMLDWGKVVERQPDWIHYLHPQLLSESSCFRETLEDFGNETILQFDRKQIITKRSEAVTWPSRCFAMDLERDLAFTYDEPFISCYHIKTGLLTAEILIPVPHNVRGPLVARRGLLCPQGKYLAVVFEAMGASRDPVGAQIRSGRRLDLNFESTRFKWTMDNALVSFDLSGILARLAVGIDSAEFVICLLELHHTGPARTHLLGLPSWTTSPVLVTGAQMMRWDLDDVDVLQFSDDSSRLATAFGIFDLVSGKKRSRWQFALDHFYQGGKITKDFKTFATILRDINGGCILQLHDVDTSSHDPNEPPRREIRFAGLVHLLAISDHGRFLLLTRREPVEEIRRAKTGKVSMLTQQVSIGVWDCRDGDWTPLLLLDRELINKLPQWNLCTYDFEPSFGPEAQQENDVNRVLLHVPQKWRLSTNVRKVKSLNPEEAHLLLFEAKRSPKGFGKNPTLKLQLPAAVFKSEKESSPTLQLMSWSPEFENATTFSNSSITRMSHGQLKEAALTFIKNRDMASQSDVIDPLKHDLQSFSSLVISATGSAIFHIKFSAIEEDTDQQTLKENKKQPTDMETYHNEKFEYDISIECLLAGESQVMSSTVALVVPRDTHDSRGYPQYICSSDETSICLGFIEIDIEYGYEDMIVSVRDVNQSIFEKALKAFNLCAHPLKSPSSHLSTVGFVDKLSKMRYTIFEGGEMNFENLDSSLKEASGSFIIQGDNFTEDHRHVFQISRPLVKNLTKNNDREARQFETFLCVYDEVRDDISWMIYSATGGDIAGSRRPSPETAWALHPELPLLAWLLPGHKLRVSNIETYDSPITIAESLAIETDVTQAVKFSPEGRYVLTQARENFKNDFLSLKRSQNLWSVILCDLQQGKSIGATLASDNNVSMDLDDHFLHTYRLTRDGAVEDSTYTLPSLVLTERQYLTFIPANCCCSTCGKTLDSQCTVFVSEYEGVKSAIVGHTPVGLGKTLIHTDTCQPLIIRIMTPPVDLNMEALREAVFSVGSERLFPRILDDQGEVIEDAFQKPHQTCTKDQELECACSMCALETAYVNDSLELTRITQMATTMSNFKLPSGLALPPGQIEEIHRLAELDATKKMSIWEESELSARNSVDNIKRLMGEETFPWDSWAEFRDAMEEIKDEFDHKAYMKRMFEPGNCGTGCQIPLFVYTFYFGNSGHGNDFKWSLATATGWLEEDLEWFYERFFGGDFAGARRWYEFPAYKALGVKMEKLKEDKTSKGKRFRTYFGPKTDEQGKVLQIELPEKEKKHVFERDGIEFDDDMKPMIGGLILKDVFESMSDLVPGLGKIFEQRLHTMLNQSLIKELEE